MSAATATLPEPVKKPRRPKIAALPAALSFPIPARGETALAGYGNWDTYLMLDEAIGRRGVRVRYNEGIIEVMSISPLHEKLKTRLGYFVAAWCRHHRIRHEMLGSATQTVRGKKAAEPDESFAFGPGSPEKPDLVIEVALTSGGMDKLNLWAGLGVPELWLWQNGTLHFFHLKKDRYVPVDDSRFLPGFPVRMMTDALAIANGSEAVDEFIRRLTEGK